MIKTKRTKSIIAHDLKARVTCLQRILSDIKDIEDECRKEKLPLIVNKYHKTEIETIKQLRFTVAINPEDKIKRMYTLKQLQEMDYNIMNKLEKVSNYRDELLESMNESVKERAQENRGETKFNLVPGCFYALELNNGCVLQLQFRMLTQKGYLIFGKDSHPQMIPIQSVERCQEMRTSTTLTEILESQRV